MDRPVGENVTGGGVSRLSFRVDWNGLDGDRIGTLLTHSDNPLGAQIDPPDVGDWVTLHDEDGLTFKGVVVRRDGLWLEAEVEWRSRSYTVVSGRHSEAQR